MACNRELITNLNFGEKKIYSLDYFSGDYNHTLYLMKSNDDGSGRDKYYLQLYTIINGVPTLQGFIYFYLNEQYNSSHFIGMRVPEEFRNLNIGSLLMSLWIDFCLNYDYNYIGVNHKQNKPFLLYMLKQYSFDVYDLSLYDSRLDVIYIHRAIDLSDTTKYLTFKDKRHEKTFTQTNSFKMDNYKIVTDPFSVYETGKVILPLQNIKRNPVDYYLKDKDDAALRAEKVMSNHRK